MLWDGISTCTVAEDSSQASAIGSKLWPRGRLPMFRLQLLDRALLSWGFVPWSRPGAVDVIACAGLGNSFIRDGPTVLYLLELMFLPSLSSFTLDYRFHSTSTSLTGGEMNTYNHRRTARWSTAAKVLLRSSMPTGVSACLPTHPSPDSRYCAPGNSTMKVALSSHTPAHHIIPFEAGHMPHLARSTSAA